VSCLKDGIPLLANYDRPAQLSGDTLLLRPFEAFVSLETETMARPELLQEHKAGLQPQVVAIDAHSL